MKKKSALLMIIALMSLFAMRSQYAYTDEQNSGTHNVAQPVKSINAGQAHELIEEKKGSPDLIIIDVRTEEEYSDGHIPNSTNIDYKSDSFKDAIGRLDKSKTYIVYCHSGRRSTAAVKIMEEMGFTDIYNMKGGIIGWQGAGFGVTK
jgi:rhodanese-related sulfurtransferase